MRGDEPYFAAFATARRAIDAVCVGGLKAWVKEADRPLYDRMTAIEGRISEAWGVDLDDHRELLSLYVETWQEARERYDAARVRIDAYRATLPQDEQGDVQSILDRLARLEAAKSGD